MVEQGRGRGAIKVEFNVGDRVSLIGSNPQSIFAERESLLGARSDDFMKQLQRQLPALAIRVLNQFVDGQPTFRVELHANHFGLMPQY